MPIDANHNHSNNLPASVDTSSVGEGSCNGGNACRYSNATVGVFYSTSHLNVNDESCNQYYACSYHKGKSSIEY